MNTETETLVNVIKSRLEEMTADERVALFENITDGYCVRCGQAFEKGYFYCHCNNDE